MLLSLLLLSLFIIFIYCYDDDDCDDDDDDDEDDDDNIDDDNDDGSDGDDDDDETPQYIHCSRRTGPGTLRNENFRNCMSWPFARTVGPCLEALWHKSIVKVTEFGETKLITTEEVGFFLFNRVD